MIKRWRQRWAHRRAIRKAAKHDAYMERLGNSVYGLCGLSFFGDEPFLSIDEVRALLREELERQCERLAADAQSDESDQ